MQVKFSFKRKSEKVFKSRHEKLKCMNIHLFTKMHSLQLLRIQSIIHTLVKSKERKEKFQIYHKPELIICNNMQKICKFSISFLFLCIMFPEFIFIFLTTAHSVTTYTTLIKVCLASLNPCYLKDVLHVIGLIPFIIYVTPNCWTHTHKVIIWNKFKLLFNKLV